MEARAEGGTRDFDVVVWGATGFVGQLVCEQLAAKYSADVRPAFETCCVFRQTSVRKYRLRNTAA